MKRKLILFIIVIVLFNSSTFSFIFANKLSLNTVPRNENINLPNMPIRDYGYNVIYDNIHNNVHNVHYTTRNLIDKEVRVKKDILSTDPQVNILAFNGLLGNITTVIVHNELLIVGTSYSIIALNQTSGMAKMS